MHCLSPRCAIACRAGSEKTEHRHSLILDSVQPLIHILVYGRYEHITSVQAQAQAQAQAIIINDLWNKRRCFKTTSRIVVTKRRYGT